MRRRLYIACGTTVRSFGWAPFYRKEQVEDFMPLFNIMREDQL